MLFMLIWSTLCPLLGRQNWHLLTASWEATLVLEADQQQAESVAKKIFSSGVLDIPQTLCKNSEISSSNVWDAFIMCSPCIVMCIKARGKKVI